MFTFEFTEEMTRKIGAILETAPYNVVAPILAEMQRQINQQTAPQKSADNGQGKPIQITPE